MTTCVLDKTRDCSSTSRSKTRYKRDELEPIAKACGIRKIKTATMDDLCTGILTSMKQKIKEQEPAKTTVPVKECKDDTIYNPLTKRCVKVSGKTGQDLYEKHKAGKLVLSTLDLQKIHQLIVQKLKTVTAHKIDVATEKVPINQDSKKMVVPKPLSTLTFTPTPQKKPMDIMHAKFKEYFKDELLGFIGKANPKFRMITSGGYGFKALIELKHEMLGRVKTADLDLTVSTYNSSYTPVDVYSHWMKRINSFIYNQLNPEDFNINVINFNNEYVPVMHFHRFYVIMLSYKGEDFVDVAITNMRIRDDMLEIPTSFKAGIPIKNEEYYLKEFLGLIYMENVPGVNYYCYNKRNPVTGALACKGAKDIDRAKLICDLKTKNKYYKYCEILADITVAKLRSMPKEERDKYFLSLQELLQMKTPSPVKN